MTSKADLIRLGDELIELGHRLKTEGEKAWDIAHGWTYGPLRPASVGERGGGTAGAEVEDRQDEARADRKAAQILPRFRGHLHQCRTEAQQARQLLGVILAGRDVRKPESRDYTAAQVAAEGWCVSCWRDDQTLVPIDKRVTGEPYHRDRCRWCGSFRAEHGQDPPLELLRLRHDGRRISQTQVDAALGKRRSA